MHLLIVESPSKAKTLKKYLGPGFEVLASYGHVRDLLPKTGSVDTDHEFAMKYEVIERNAKHVEAIARAVKKADEVLIATDPDREGEAIAWHLAEILRERKLLTKKPLKRVVFHEITERAVKEAIAHPRDIAMELVNAQQARRALDYLVGFNLSPLLWKKISPGLSAGRVQSPALRLICEREEEIERFVPREYWTIHLDSHQGRQKFGARLTQFEGEKIQQFSIENEARQKQVVEALTRAANGSVTVAKVEKKRKQRLPAAPFTTSTLQQEAVRKLGFSAERAMRTAQQLYEGIDIGGGAVGLITYMRTDSVNLAQEAIAEIRAYIAEHFSRDYLPAQAVVYANKAKNAQEAHEAIRPTSIARTPDSLKDHLGADQFKLYEMIWKRALACQMAPAQLDTVAADLAAGSAGVFRATGQTIAFDGFLAVYHEDADEPSEDEEEAKLPPLKEGETLPVDAIRGEQHFTQPPPRYSEASLVKTLEEYGIGRPSTYASIISTLLYDRENIGPYAVLEKKRFKPTPMGRLVNCFLTHHFDHYVDYGFTAHMEDELDDISNGTRTWVPVMHEFWDDFANQLQAKDKVERGCPMDEACPKCGKTLLLQASKRGLFVGCSGYPACDYTRPFGDAASADNGRVLGTDPASGLPVTLLNGRYGWYVQLGEQAEGSKVKPRRASWPKERPVETADLETALKLLSLPREVGTHPETGKPIVANIGRFGPYLLHDGKFKSIPKAYDVYSVDLKQALEILALPPGRRGASADPGRELGKHPADGAPVVVKDGRYGPYVQHGKINATLPKDFKPDTITLAEALDLIAAKAAKGPAEKKPARKTAAQAAAQEPAKRAKAPAKKAASPRKTAAKK